MTYDVPMLLTVNNYYGVLQSVLQNLGIGVLPDYLSRDFPQIWSGSCPMCNPPRCLSSSLIPRSLRQSKRVEAFRDFVTEEVIAYRRRKKEEATEDA
jgi:DNA-binding transcriptional LysR family regulator